MFTWKDLLLFIAQMDSSLMDLPALAVLLNRDHRLRFNVLKADGGAKFEQFPFLVVDDSKKILSE